MRETQRNIRTYKKKLIGLKEKLATAGLLFLMSAVMLTTASFAWITLSTAPEVTSISTSIAGNGNLEIALSSTNKDSSYYVPKEPAISEVGDSNKELPLKNITWGNLVNLNHISYGLDSIILRPAILDAQHIGTNPLKAAEYGEDGRIIRSYNNFAYGNYSENENTFLITKPEKNEYGVRAISSVITQASGEDAEQNWTLLDNIVRSLDDATSNYLSELVGNDDYINSIAGLMGAYLTDGMNPDRDPTVCDKEIEQFYYMMLTFKKSMDSVGEVYTKIINTQLQKGKIAPDKIFTFSELLNDNYTQQSLASKYSISMIDGFNTFISDYKGLENAIKNVSKELALLDSGEKKHLYVDDVTSEIMFFVDIGSCYIDDDPKQTVDYLRGNKSQAASLVMGGGTHTGTIQKGALQRFEQLTGARMTMTKPVEVNAYYIVNVTLRCYISTNATEPYILPEMIEGEENSMSSFLLENVQLIETSGDVYGMVIDFWVRTNETGSYLKLEGEVVPQYSVMTTADGACCYKIDDTLYYMKGSNCQNLVFEGTEYPTDNQLTPDLTTMVTALEEGKVYNYSTNLQVVVEDAESTEDINEVEEYAKLFRYALSKTIIGYDGANRVWEESELWITEGSTSTTQGKGSCFIFYPEDPIEQERMLKLLNAFTVVFIDEHDKVMAIATLNSSEAYEESGKITVPLQLISGAENPLNYEELVITELEQNVSTFISALIYLDGSLVSNQDVSAVSNIKGALNLQFGSTIELGSMDDETLQKQSITLSASISKGNVEDADTILNMSQKNIEYKVEDILEPSTVKIDIIGVEPQTVTANFVRQLNQYQGVRQEEIVFTKTIVLDSSTNTEKTVWLSNESFDTPGDYIMRSVWVDNIEYDVDTPLTVKVEGFEITNTSWDLGTNFEVHRLTSGTSFPVSVTIEMKTSDRIAPSNVKALLRNEYNEYVTIHLYEDSNGDWTGQGEFISSGKYILEYLVVNDEYHFIPTDLQRVANITLGIEVEVEIPIDSREFEWDPQKESNPVDKISVRVLDNNGNQIRELPDLGLRYKMVGSSDTRTDLITALTWNSEKDCYTGKFLDVEIPGFYDFRYVDITHEGETSYINDGTAPNIWAKSPYSPEYLENSLNAELWQFAPDGSGGFSIDIANSGGANVTAVMTFTNTNGVTSGEPVYVNLLPENSSLLDSSNNSYTWTFTMPSNGDAKQTGHWKLEEIRLSQVYDGETEKYYEATDEWWKQSSDKYITWVAGEDIDNLEFNILNDVHITVSNSFKYPPYTDVVNYTNDMKGTVTFKDDFTEFMLGKYTGTDYTLMMKDYLGNAINSNYEISISSSSLSYGYSQDSSAIGNAEIPGWWIEDPLGKVPYTMVGTYQVEVADRNPFAGDTMIFDYPGKYVPETTIVLSQGGSLYSNLSDTNKEITVTDAIVVKHSISTIKVEWTRPDVIFTNVTYKDTRFPTYDGSGNVDKNNTDGINTVSLDGKSIKVYSHLGYSTSSGWFGSTVENFEYTNPTATLTLVDIKSYSEVTLTIENAGGRTPGSLQGTAFSKNITATWTGNEASVDLILGEKETYSTSRTLARTDRPNISCIGDNSSASTFTVTLNSKTYKFNLDGNLVVDYDY